MEGRRSLPLRVLELRTVTGQGGGPEKSILLTASRADPARVRISLCYLSRRGGPDLWVRARAAELGVDFHHLIERRALDPRTLPRLFRLVRAQGIDVVHSHDYKSDFFAFLLAATGRVSAMATAHGWTGPSWRERLVYYPADKRLLARFAAVVAVSEEIRLELLRHGAPARRVHTLLNAIEPASRRDEGRRSASRAAWGAEPADVVIGAVGRLERQKRLDLLLDACTRLLPRHPHLRLVVAGEGAGLGALRALAASRGLSGRCTFLGHQSDVEELHHGLDLFVQASDYEGSPNAVLEAMALETPIVATRVGAVPELIEDEVHGLLVPAGDATALAAAIERVLTDPAAARGRAAAARRQALERFSFARRVRQLEDLYARVRK